MKIYSQEAIVDLNANEVAVFIGKTAATPAMLQDRHHPNGTYRTFREKVEHAASEIHHETERTVLITDEETGATLARYNDNGLVDEAQS